MKKHIKLILIIVTILSVVLGAIFYMGHIDVNKDNYENKQYLDKVSKYIQSYEIENFDKNKIKTIKLNTTNILEKTSSKDIMSQTNYILGYIDALEKENNKAIEKFNISISNFEKLKQGKIKTQVYYELSRMYLYEGEYKKSEEAFEKMKETGMEVNKKDDIVKYSLRRAYDIYHSPNGINQSIEILEDTLKTAKKIKYKEVEDVYFELGRLYWSDDRLIDAINTKLEALDIARSKKLKSKISKISTDIGIDYLYSGNYEEAVLYFKRVLSSELKDKYEDVKSKSYALLNLCEAYIRLGEYEKSKEVFKQLEKNIENQRDGVYKEDCITFMYVNRADLETELGNARESLKLLNKAQKRYDKRDNFKFFDFDVRLAEEYGDAYYKLGFYNEALKYHKKAEEKAQQRELTYLELDHNGKIYKDYKAIGDFNNTIKYLERNNELKTKLSSDSNRQYSQYLINEFENDKNLEKISHLEKFKETMWLVFVMLCIVTLLISMFTYAIYKKNREIKRLNKLFKNLSITDSLTNVQNRRALDEYLTVNWNEYETNHMPISFIMIDIDFFKKYNDNYGHPEGDVVLIKVANNLKKSCRNIDFLARYGGEEFIIVMLNTDKDKAIKLVDKIRDNINTLNIKHEYSEISDRLTLSIGITTAYSGSNTDYKDYIKKADKALYKAKEKGRNTYVFSD